MKRFHFPLRPVGVVRAHRELRAREALAISLRSLAQAEAELTETRAVSAEQEAVIAAGRRGRFQAAAEAVFFLSYQRARAAELAGEKRVQTARAEMELRRTECVEANRALKVIHRLEERARAAHRADGLRTEQNENDEIAGFRAFQNPSLL